MTQEIELQSNDAQSLLPHLFRASKALSILNITLPRRTTEEKIAELKRSVYDETLQPIEEKLQTENTRFNLFYQEYGKNPVVHFNKPLKITVELAHPDAQRLLNLLIIFDLMNCKLAELWFAKQIDSVAYFEATTNCRKALKEALKRINSLVYQVMNNKDVVREGPWSSEDVSADHHK